MLSLEQMQASMMEVLDHGPAYLQPDMFEGPRAIWLRGLKVHANTISHARLVALEETFPKTRECLGHAVFNELSRDYVEHPGVPGLSLDQIGHQFAQFLASRDIEKQVLDLARFEWEWLESYHAAEAAVLNLSDLAGLSDAKVLALPIALHPSVRTVRFETSPHEILAAEIPGLADAAGLLIVRPFEQVLLSSLNSAQLKAISHAGGPITIGNLLTKVGEQHDDTELLPTFISLVEAGALTRVSGDLA
ncbi:putative DNA-binding domain-containing protein [Allopontixanthobacter sp.]|uniref:HvfC/BufC family peptide modification chaperone n=1 Tax=Allopontixanthobacter sp. TaxID=2906452 RepID=UPI002ABC2E65|nr:putative DNA-binding domain-containing protein [Allopontixanthobacter sp.]MDZ4307015.1 putative DNA-binding domain-containing protein [Allopontixanthobacter sp.]